MGKQTINWSQRIPHRHGACFKDLKQFRGFTLIELLIVIAIILILIAIALPNFLEAQIRAKIVQSRADMRTIGIAMDTYLIDWRMYPPDHDPNDFAQNGFYQLTSPLSYLTEFPNNPFATGTSGLGDPGDEFGYEMGSTGLTPRSVMFGRAVRANVHTFNIQNYAPDTDDDWHGNDEWPFCGGGGNPCQNGGCNWTNYSPTNGTKSNGDLNHTGGEFRNGTYCVDGWQHIVGKFI